MRRAAKGASAPAPAAVNDSYLGVSVPEAEPHRLDKRDTELRAYLAERVSNVQDPIAEAERIRAAVLLTREVLALGADTTDLEGFACAGTRITYMPPDAVARSAATVDLYAHGWYAYPSGDIVCPVDDALSATFPL